VDPDTAGEEWDDDALHEPDSMWSLLNGEVGRARVTLMYAAGYSRKLNSTESGLLRQVESQLRAIERFIEEIRDAILRWDVNRDH